MSFEFCNSHIHVTSGVSICLKIARTPETSAVILLTLVEWREAYLHVPDHSFSFHVFPMAFAWRVRGQKLQHSVGRGFN